MDSSSDRTVFSVVCTPDFEILAALQTVWMYLCTVIIITTYSKGKDQPGKVANPARGQLNRENEYFPVPVRA